MGESLKDQAYRLVKTKIISCEYPPGMVVNEDRLQNDLNITRTPLRDAICRLEQEGFISVRPKKGMVITDITAGDLNQLLEAIIILETSAIKNYATWMDKTSLRELYKYMSSFWDYESCSESIESNMSKVMESTGRLHQLIVDNIRNVHLKKLLSSLQEQRDRVYNMLGWNTVIDYLIQYFSAPNDTIDVVRALIENRYNDAVTYLNLTMQSEKNCILMAWIAMQAENNEGHDAV